MVFKVQHFQMHCGLVLGRERAETAIFKEKMTETHRKWIPEGHLGPWIIFFFRGSTKNIISKGSTTVWTLWYVQFLNILRFLFLMQDFQQCAGNHMYTKLPYPIPRPNLCSVENFSSIPLSCWYDFSKMEIQACNHVVLPLGVVHKKK